MAFKYSWTLLATTSISASHDKCTLSQNPRLGNMQIALSLYIWPCNVFGKE